MGSWLIRGAHLLTLDGADSELVTGDLRIADQHISDIGGRTGLTGHVDRRGARRRRQRAVVSLTVPPAGRFRELNARFHVENRRPAPLTR